MVGRGRNRTSCPKGVRLQRTDSTSFVLIARPISNLREPPTWGGLTHLVVQLYQGDTGFICIPYTYIPLRALDLKLEDSGGIEPLAHGLKGRCPPRVAIRSLSIVEL